MTGRPRLSSPTSPLIPLLFPRHLCRGDATRAPLLTGRARIGGHQRTRNHPTTPCPNLGSTYALHVSRSSPSAPSSTMPPRCGPATTRQAPHQREEQGGRATTPLSRPSRRSRGDRCRRLLPFPRDGLPGTALRTPARPQLSTATPTVSTATTGIPAISDCAHH
jgi:hypothetical protein